MQEAWTTLQRGGIMMIPLVISSIIALAIIIERSISLRRKKVLIPEIINVIETLQRPEDIHLAISICNKNKGAFANIIMLGLENSDLDKAELKELIEEQGRQEVRELEKGLAMLETIAGIAPLMGLLGTVLGMVSVFTVITEKGIGQAQLLSGGIAEALITTVAGLFIGIPALFMYNYFTHKAENFILDIEKFTSTLIRKLNRFKSPAQPLKNRNEE
ncbi:MAG: MotA/TolQ/ExbB proton channel family protein [Candidatus Zhuqueibacterota bacterium]